eukprot:888794-Pyramimonas_sp.AAC.1
MEDAAYCGSSRGFSCSLPETAVCREGCPWPGPHPGQVPGLILGKLLGLHRLRQVQVPPVLLRVPRNPQ